MFRDLFAQLYVPVVFGAPQVDFVELIDLSDEQKIWLRSDEPAWLRFEDQALDLFDFGYGYMELGQSRPVPDRAKDLIYRAHVHLEGAAATATSAFDYRGTIHSALLGAELAVKAGLICVDYDDGRLRKEIGHDLAQAARVLGQLATGFDEGRVLRAVSSFPPFAQSRYDGPQPSRIETGHILMKAQYIASEVTRAFTNRNLRGNHSMRIRVYPE